MAIVDREKRNAYIKEWKRQRRLQDGKFPQEKTPKPVRTTEQIEQSIENKKEHNKNRYEQSPYHTVDIRQRMIYNAKRRATIKGLPFNLVLDDIVIPEKCPYLGVPLQQHAFRSSYRGDVASLDRIDSTKGYTPDNIEVISNLANSMKNGASIEQLLLFAKEVLNRYG